MRVQEFIERLAPSDYEGGKKSLKGTKQETLEMLNVNSWLPGSLVLME